MISNRSIRTFLISFLLLLGSLLSALVVISPVNADQINGETTFYFKDVLGIQETPEYDSTGLSILVSQTRPIKQNDSVYPPNIFNGLTLNSEEWLIWLTTTWILYFIDDFADEYSEYADLLDEFELFFPHPLRILETYEHTGSEAIEIDGDVDFDLYFSSKTLSNFGEKDRVNVGLYSLNLDSLLPIPKMIKNETVDIQSESGSRINKQMITIKNINHTIEPGESLLFKVEIILGNKTITEWLNKERPILDQYKNRSIDLIKNLINNSGNPTLQNISEFIDEISSIAEEYNITKEDTSEIINSIISSSLVYDSVSHPSSVTLPFIDPNAIEDENTKIYYLHSGSEMDEQVPTKEEYSSNNLENTVNWNGPDLSRSKILEEATASLYIKYKDYNIIKDKIKITASLMYNSVIIDSTDIELDKTIILSSNSIAPIVFSFNNLENEEIIYNNHLSFKVSISNDTDFNSGLLRSAEIVYDSKEYPSSLSLKFIDTDHIELDFSVYPEDNKITPGESVIYTLEITSEYDDEIEIIETSFSGEKDNWDIIIPEKFNISSGEKKTIDIIIKSTINNLDAYGDSITIRYNVNGNTGKDTFTAYAEISEDAVEYSIKIIKPIGREIKRGSNDTYHFIIKNNNSGLWPDSYSIDAVSENNFTVELNLANVYDLAVGEEKKINVTIYIPKNTNITSDLLIFTVTSVDGDISKTENVTTTVIGSNVIEGIYDFFESAAEALGLNEIFGSLGPIFLVAIILIIVFFILIITVFIQKTRQTSLICLDRIKEITTEENAKFEITIKNVTKKTQNYNLSPKEDLDSNKWDISLDLKRITLEPGQSKTAVITVRPTDLIRNNDWVEVDLLVKKEGKRKPEKLTTMTLLKDTKINLAIRGVLNWPKLFKEGDRVTTTFKVENKGNASASGIDVILYINGKEKNKVGDIIIPAGGYADIKMPWIAVKGKNEINIVVE